MNSISTEIKELLAKQKIEWPLAGKNFAELKNVQVREFQYDGFRIKVQFNPGRIVSSAAKVDKKSIEDRQCFLCAANRPEVQRGVNFDDFAVLVNPFPIFPEHFTIPAHAHQLQRIKGNFDKMLYLSKAMSGFTLFYNGPKCGASAPDHFHFQAGNNGFMPLVGDLPLLKKQFGKRLTNRESDLWTVKDGLRNFLFLESKNSEELKTEFESIYTVLENFSTAEEEPMLNILSLFDAGKWLVFIFPRAKHRPWQFFEEGAENILLSPASVDMGGVLITPLEKDFKKITKEDVHDIFGQVLLPNEDFDKLTQQISNQ